MWHICWSPSYWPVCKNAQIQVRTNTFKVDFLGKSYNVKKQLPSSKCMHGNSISSAMNGGVQANDNHWLSQMVVSVFSHQFLKEKPVYLHNPQGKVSLCHIDLCHTVLGVSEELNDLLVAHVRCACDTRSVHERDWFIKHTGQRKEVWPPLLLDLTSLFSALTVKNSKTCGSWKKKNIKSLWFTDMWMSSLCGF